MFVTQPGTAPGAYFRMPAYLSACTRLAHENVGLYPNRAHYCGGREDRRAEIAHVLCCSKEDKQEDRAYNVIRGTITDMRISSDLSVARFLCPALSLIGQSYSRSLFHMVVVDDLFAPWCANFSKVFGSTSS